MEIFRACNDKTQIWILPLDESVLYSLDPASGFIRRVTELVPSEKVTRPFGDIGVCGDYLVFPPNQYDKLLIIDKRNMELKEIVFPEKWTLQYIEDKKFYGGVIFRDKYYLLGNAFAGIVCVNLTDYTIRQVASFEGILDKNNDTDGYLSQNYCIRGNVGYFPFMNSNAFFSLNFDTDEINIIKVGDKSQRFISIEYIDDAIWLIPRDAENGKIIRWNARDTKETIIDYPTMFEPAGLDFNQIIRLRNMLYVFAHNGDYNLKIDTISLQVDVFDDLYDVPNRGSKYPYAFLHNEIITILTKEALLNWNPQNETVRIQPYQYDDKTLWIKRNASSYRFYKKIKEVVIGESKNHSLNEFLGYVSST